MMEMKSNYELTGEQIFMLARLAVWCIERKISPFNEGFDVNKFLDSEEDCADEVAEFVERLWGAKCCCTEEIPLKCTCFDPEKLADFDDGNHAIDPSKQ